MDIAYRKYASMGHPPDKSFKLRLEVFQQVKISKAIADSIVISVVERCIRSIADGGCRKRE